MVRQSFLRMLRCPYCGGDLELEDRPPHNGTAVEYGTLRCQCYRYGIVLGIVVLRQASAPSDNTDPVVAALDAGKCDRALDVLLAHETASLRRHRPRIPRLADWLNGRTESRPGPTTFPASESLRSVLRRWRPDSYGEYLEYRYANPSLLGSIPVIAAMAANLSHGEGDECPPWVIDIGCGIGHTAYLLKSLAPRAQVVAADLDFLNLLLAKQYVLPDENFVCFDAEAGLPFKDDAFDAAFSLDCVHYIRGKHHLASELHRVGRPKARYALCHIHNATRHNPNQGIPLSPEGYARVFSPLGGRLYSESALLRGFSESGRLPLDLAADAATSDAPDAFAYLSLREHEAETATLRLDRNMAASLTSFSLNGLYGGSRSDGAFELRLRWPSEKLRTECCAGFEPLQDRVPLARSVADAVIGQRFQELPEELFEALIRSFVVVPQPDSLRSQP